MKADVPGTLNRILEAHGGLQYWQSLAAVEVSMSTWGFLFQAKRIRPLDHAVITVDTNDPRVVMKDFPSPGCTTALLGTRRVETRDASGAVLRYRDNPRQAFGAGRRSLYWDELDFAYFCGYAMWTYLTLPFLLLRTGVSIDRCEQDVDGSTTLAVGFPDYLPTHSPTQTLYFNPAQLWTYLPIWLAVLLIGWDSARLLRRQARQGL